MISYQTNRETNNIIISMCYGFILLHSILVVGIFNETCFAFAPLHVIISKSDHISFCAPIKGLFLVFHVFWLILHYLNAYSLAKRVYWWSLYQTPWLLLPLHAYCGLFLQNIQLDEYFLDWLYFTFWVYFIWLNLLKLNNTLGKKNLRVWWGVSIIMQAIIII